MKLKHMDVNPMIRTESLGFPGSNPGSFPGEVRSELVRQKIASWGESQAKVRDKVIDFHILCLLLSPRTPRTLHLCLISLLSLISCSCNRPTAEGQGLGRDKAKKKARRNQEKLPQHTGESLKGAAGAESKVHTNSVGVESVPAGQTRGGRKSVIDTLSQEQAAPAGLHAFHPPLCPLEQLRGRGRAD